MGSLPALSRITSYNVCYTKLLRLEAFQYGAPPHGGIALGIDRLLAILLGAESIREVIAFPKTQRATCMLTGAPSQVERKQLRELYLTSAVPAPKPEKG